ncbi:MAG TPA: VOC family protein [Candidatus Binatia bacterium]|jgi:catechol 2,3-dioxygenase-like lactoylglutathione lyase family enzyme|nr:VOC family protein [Candidatus Binatia bacterium]
MRLDSVEISVADLDACAAAYALLLGVPPTPLAGGAYRFQLARGAVEIAPGDAGLRAVRFAREPGDPAPWPDPAFFYGLRVEPATATAAAPEALPAVQALDHVVVRTPDADRAIALWRDRLGLRLAFDRAFPERGLRLVFMRSGGITFEFATAEPPPEDRRGDDLLWGVSYRVADLRAHRERLVAAGFDVTPIRAGHKAGTRVATVRSGTAGVPTLLLEAAPEAA